MGSKICKGICKLKYNTIPYALNPGNSKKYWTYKKCKTCMIRVPFLKCPCCGQITSSRTKRRPMKDCN